MYRSTPNVIVFVWRFFFLLALNNIDICIINVEILVKVCLAWVFLLEINVVEIVVEKPDGTKLIPV